MPRQYFEQRRQGGVNALGGEAPRAIAAGTAVDEDGELDYLLKEWHR